MTDLTVNGRPVTVHTDPDTPLLTVLREDLGLLGSRFGCGIGLCGACFVRLDETVVASCDTPLWQAAGRAVLTVEGHTVDGRPHPVQRAILDHQAAQCGFCISGDRGACRCSPRRAPAPRRGNGRRGTRRQPVPLRSAAPDRCGGPGGGLGARMTTAQSLEVPADVRANPRLGSWISLTADGRVGVRVGKVELGQGILTALAQIVADALDLPADRIAMLAAHTALGPDEGLTAGSLSTATAGPALRHVGAVVRDLVARAAVDDPDGLVPRPRRSDRPRHRPDRVDAGHPPGRRGGTPARRHRPAPARPARQGPRPPALHRRPATRRSVVRPRRATPVRRRPS